MKAISQSSVTKKAMRRVVAVFYLRKVLNPFVLKSGILVLGALAFGSLVHVAMVFENMPSVSDVAAFAQFSFAAFINTEVMVQAVIVALGLVTLWLARDVIMALIHKTRTSSMSHYSHA